MMTNLEKELKKKNQHHLIALCDSRDLDHTGNKSVLAARLAAYEAAKEPEPGPGPGAPEPGVGSEPEPGSSEPGAGPRPEEE